MKTKGGTAYPQYAKDRKPSPNRRKGAESRQFYQHAIGAIVELTDKHQLDAQACRNTLNELVRAWHWGGSNRDCDFHSEGALNASADTVVEVEHLVEVAEIVRHLSGAGQPGGHSTKDPRLQMEDMVRKMSAKQSAKKIEQAVARINPPPSSWLEANENMAAIWVDFSKPSLVEKFLLRNHITVLVTKQEHERLGKAAAGASSFRLGTLYCQGGFAERYIAAGVRFAPISKGIQACLCRPGEQAAMLGEYLKVERGIDLSARPTSAHCLTACQHSDM